MEYREIKKDQLIVFAENFTPKYPDVVVIDYKNEKVTVLDSHENEHILPFDQVKICEIIKADEPLKGV